MNGFKKKNHSNYHQFQYFILKIQELLFRHKIMRNLILLAKALNFKFQLLEESNFQV